MNAFSSENLVIFVLAAFFFFPFYLPFSPLRLLSSGSQSRIIVDLHQSVLPVASRDGRYAWSISISGRLVCLPVLSICMMSARPSFAQEGILPPFLVFIDIYHTRRWLKGNRGSKFPSFTISITSTPYGQRRRLNGFPSRYSPPHLLVRYAHSVLCTGQDAFFHALLYFCKIFRI